ncbi:MAG: TonB-dependent receptor [Saprospiraceae bacterium]|nr:TonB-dependent receptor [Saprospiraceae bacterium]
MNHSGIIGNFIGGIISLVLVVSATAQSLEIQGQVIDAVSADPLVGATVQASASGTFTDLTGRFSLSINPQNRVITISYVGYKSLEFSVPTLDSLQMLNLQLEPISNLLNEVTVTTGKYEQPLGETTVSLEILRPALLEQTNTTSIDDVLGKVPGVAIIDGQANIRGGSGFSYGAGSRVLVLVDDIPAYQADAGFPNWDDFPIENLAQVEVVKGAASALYGSAALNGIINLRTAYAREKPHSKISIFGGQMLAPRDPQKKWWSKAPGEFGFSATDARRIGKFDLVHAVYFLDRNSVNREGYDQYGRINSKIRYKLTERVELGIRGSFNRGVDQSFFYWLDSGSGAYQGDSSAYSTSDYFRYSVDPYLKIINDRGDRHEFKSRLFHVDNRNNAGRSNTSKLWYGEYQFLHRMPGINAILTTGLVGIKTNVQAELYGDTTLKSNNIAAFLQLEKKWHQLSLNLGVRYEQNTVSGPSAIGTERIPNGKIQETKPVFRLGANYQLAEGTYLRASWGQGYRYPTIAEKYISTSFGATLISPNLSLQSETGWSGEVGLKQGFELGEFGGFIDVAAYWSEYFDMMEFVFTGLIKGFQSQNVGDTRIRGIDVSLNARGNLLGVPATMMAGYTFVDPTFQNFTARDSMNSTAGYNILKYRSKHLVKFDGQTDFDKLNVGLSVQYTSNMEAIDRVFYLFVPGLEKFRDTHRGYALTDLRVLYAVTDRMTLSTQCRNLFNVEYSERPGLLAPPRSVTFRLDYEL